MNLDNARSLKRDFLVRARADEAQILRRSTKFSAARPTSPPMIAVGIAPNSQGKDFRVAVRLERPTPATAEFVKQLEHDARGEIDVRVVHGLHALKGWQRQRVRPLAPGISIGHHNVTAGTLGAFVRCRMRGRLGLLSNNHVLADTNVGRRGDPIISPGRQDGGVHPADVVGHLDAFKRISFSSGNTVDAAVAILAEGVEVAPNVLRGIGPIRGIASPESILEDRLEVKKFGRTTGRKRGRVTAVELSGLKVTFDAGKVAVFDNQIEIQSATSQAFSRGGDSGSLIVTTAGLAVGLLFAGNGDTRKSPIGLTYANPIHAVLEALAIDLITD